MSVLLFILSLVAFGLGTLTLLWMGQPDYSDWSYSVLELIGMNRSLRPEPFIMFLTFAVLIGSACIVRAVKHLSPCIRGHSNADDGLEEPRTTNSLTLLDRLGKGESETAKLKKELEEDLSLIEVIRRIRLKNKV